MPVNGKGRLGGETAKGREVVKNPRALGPAGGPRDRGGWR